MQAKEIVIYIVAIAILGLCNGERVNSFQYRDHKLPDLRTLFAKQPAGKAAPTCPIHPNPVNIDDTTLFKLLQPTLQKLDAALTSAFSKSELPGATVIAVYNQTTLYTRGFGAKNLSSNPIETPDGDTTFRIGSISKVFVNMMAYMLRDQGLIAGMDSEITDYLPDFSMIDIFGVNRGITFEQLGSHLAGTPRESPCEAIVGLCNYTTDEMIQRLKSQYYILPPNVQPSYSNLGFALSGRVLERVVGQRYEDYVVENILQPLDMANTGFDYTAQVLKGLAVGYMGGDPSAPALPYDLGWENPAGQMYSSVNDFAKWMKWFFQVNTRTGYDQTPPKQNNNNNNNNNNTNKKSNNNNNNNNNKNIKVKEDTHQSPDWTVLQPSTVREMFLPKYINDDGITGFGLPWEMYRDAFGYWYLTKSGSVIGYTSLIVLNPTIKFGYATLASADTPGLTYLMNAIGQILEPALQDILQKNQPKPQLPPNYQSYIGNYTAQGAPFPSTAIITLEKDNSGNPVLNVENTVIFNGISIHLLNGWLLYDPSIQKLRYNPTKDSAVSNCSVYEGGAQQFVLFTTDSQGNISFEIPGLWYGFVYYKQ